MHLYGGIIMSKSSKTTTKKLSKEHFLSYIFVILIPLICIMIGYIKGGISPFGDKDMLTISKSADDLYKYFDFFCSKGFLSEASLPILINVLYLILIPISCFTMFIYLDNSFIIDISPTSSINNNTEDNNNSPKKKNIVLGGSYLPKTNIGKFILRLNPIRIVLSISYGLSMFFLSEGADISFLPAMTIFPLLMLGLNKLIEGKSSKTFIIFLTISIYLSIYISIISFIFSLLYLVVSLIEKRTKALNIIKKYITATIFALLISAAKIIPAIANHSLQGIISLSFVRPAKINNPWNVFSQFMFNSKVADLNMYNSGVNLYGGLLILLLFFGFIINKNIKISKRIGYFIITISLLLGTVFSTPNYLFNGFRAFYNNTFVYGYIYIFLLIIMAYETITNIDGINKVLFSIFSITLAAMIILTMKHAEILDSIKPLYYSLEILFAYFLIVLVYRDKSLSKVLFTILISLLCLFEVTFTYTSNLANKGKVAYTRPVKDTLTYKHYRAEEYIRGIDAEAKALYLDETGLDTNPLLYSIEGYNYIITGKAEDSVDPMLQYVTTIKEDGMVRPLYVYKNPNAISSAIWNENITSYKYDFNYPFASANILSEKYAECGALFSIVDGNTEANPTSDQNIISFSFSASELGPAYTRAYYSEYIGDNSKIKPIPSMQIRPIDRYNNFIFQYALFDAKTLEELTQKVTSDTDNQHISPDNKEYQVNASQDGYLSLPVKNTSDLRVMVNGKRANVSSFTANTILIPIEEGTNSVRIYYSKFFYILGVLISIAAIILIVKTTAKSKKYKKLTSMIYHFIYDNHIYFIVIAIMTLIFILCQMYTGSYPFGTRSTLMDDGITQTFPIYVSRARSIKAGNGLSLFINSNMHIWDILRMWILPESMYLFDFTFTFFIYYLLNPLCLIYYLTNRHLHPYDKKDKRLIILGLIYGLSSYAIIMFVYAGFRLLIYIPIVILGLEKLIYEKKSVLYIIALAMIMMYDAYPALMLSEMLILFFISYRFDNIKHFVKTGTRFALSSIAAAGIAAFRLLPYFNMSSGSGYAEADSVKPSIFSFYKSFTALLSDYRPLTYLRAISDDNSKAAIYIGMMMLIFIPLYALNHNISIATRIKKIVFIILIYLAFNNEILNYLFHGMHYQSLVPNRFAIFFVFIIVTMIADTLPTINSYRNITLISVNTVVICLYYLVHFINRSYTEKSTIIGLIFLFIPLLTVIAEMFIDMIKHIKKNYLEKVIIYIMLIDILVNGAYLFVNNIGSSSTLLTEAAYVNNLLDNYPDMKKPYTEAVYLDSSNYNLPTLTGYASPVRFFSGISSYALNTCNKYNIHYSANTIYYGTGNPLADMMMGIKYHIADSYTNATPMTPYPLTKSVNNMNVYENPYSLSPGFFIDNKYLSGLDKWDKREDVYQNILEYQNSFSKAFINKDIYEPIDISFKKNNTVENIINNTPQEADDVKGSYYMIGVLENTSNSQRTSFKLPVYVHIDASSVKPGKYYISVLDYIMYLGEINDSDIDLSVDIPADRYYSDETIKSTFSVGRFSDDNMNELHNLLAENELMDVDTHNGITTGTITSNGDGILYISNEYSDGTKLKIDDNEVKTVPYIGGTAVPISSGKHTVSISSKSEYMNEGVIVSISTIIILLLITIYIKRKPNNTAIEEN